MDIKAKFEEAKERTKEFCKKNWPYLVAGATVVTGIVGLEICKKNHSGSPDITDNPLEEGCRVNSWIDEDIYTYLAPRIEGALLDKEKCVCTMNTVYPVKFPKNGDFKNGSYTIDKSVSVVIKDANE